MRKLPETRLVPGLRTLPPTSFPVSHPSLSWSFVFCLLALSGRAYGQAGSIRGVIRDKDFDVPLTEVSVRVLETQQTVASDRLGAYLVPQLEPRKYTLIFSKAGYIQVVRTDVQVAPGQLTDLDIDLIPQFTELEEFIVDDILSVGTGSEAELLQLRIESPSLISAISSELISRAGASDAADALKLVSGATIQDGKFPVIRGLPDRYVASKLNEVRLPSADAETRAVELDQFPSSVINSIQVSKTFTPDQQGDASGGAVNLELRGIPDEAFFVLKTGVGYNSQAAGSDNFLSYEGGGVRDFGRDDGRRDPQPEGNFDGAVGVIRQRAPVDSKWSAAFGDSFELDNGWKVGGSGSLFYERDSTHFENGVADTLEVETPGEGLQSIDPTGDGLGSGDFTTSLFDVEQSSQSVQWGGLASIGIENDNHKLGGTYLYSRSATDTATLAEDTRGRELFFPGHDPTDPDDPGNAEPSRAPFLRNETLEYVERVTRTLQLRGEHTLPWLWDNANTGPVVWNAPVFSWLYANSAADSNEPDKRQFGTAFSGPRVVDNGPFLPPTKAPPTHTQNPPSQNINLGALQRTWETIQEDSNQLQLSLQLPFEYGANGDGYLKFGFFQDRVTRDFNQDSFSNPGDTSTFNGTFDEFFSGVFPDEDHPLTATDTDVDYRGRQDITATFGMIDLPVTNNLTLIGGARFESTSLGISNDPEEDAFLFPVDGDSMVVFTPEEGDVSIDQDDVLPAVALTYDATDTVTVRTSFAKTLARQTFRELSPIIQQEFLGGPIFIGNPNLQISEVDNWDVRVDWKPLDGTLLSLSYFLKNIDDPIESVATRNVQFGFTTPLNFTEAKISGFELEARTNVGDWLSAFDGLTAGFNATLIQSEVTLPDDLSATFDEVEAPLSSRDATGAPEHIFNLFFTYDLPDSGTQFGLFYTVTGDTLIAGASAPAASSTFIPNIYARQFDSLNLTYSQQLTDYCQLQIQAKNITNPLIETVFRSDFSGPDTTNTSFRNGREFSISLVFNF